MTGDVKVCVVCGRPALFSNSFCSAECRHERRKYYEEVKKLKGEKINDNNTINKLPV